MGLFGFGGGKKKQEQPEEKKNVDEKVDTTAMAEDPKGGASSSDVVRLNEAPSGPKDTDVSVFEFGSAGSTDDKITLAGYCPVSDEMEPCRWEIFPSGQAEAPGFRIVF
ncbi:hypothetical protein MPTK1_5g07680 [Marchantia polymorpha subsp. ruderalis]|uniref:Allyl alcohol dehydrogenase-like protein n=2 Tax=Marchantia polymorpha TaxID=3197 RepID=A0AAF6BFZ9_MARPO|nr:hypothetical protein MARPO_0127s0016 [Marchantia polymorpha]BBN10933.1 hypothetical protein Mp_5g07680 [Marchantia polymorpha subsp. ruderalis]|eukprot:PTQ30229.1 hypothetical protein MARPO_0127s0016 [Marchantia polymorpha]